ncbi:hypothetical protein [Chryseolinea sp. H1M3-3]|uniref:hypothetical protein n=1 Tax=Chryseolinea sp. H1M3-3 TaxID=3034144 RepID=UPI0023EB1D90|nr:hypothetical protein [Chryseolinea sp. H1M3-3]
MEQIYTYKFSLLSLSGEVNLQVSSSNGPGIETFMDDFRIIFSRQDSESGGFIINAFQVYSPEIEKKINELIEKYGEIDPTINKIPAYFRKLKANENFVFVPPGYGIDQSHRILLYNYLKHLEEGVPFEPLQAATDSLFKEIFAKYDVNSFGDKRISIGEPDKKKRVCRFCNNKRVPLTFKNKAHAISEGLGNKTVVLNDECDGCNSEFSKNTEQDMIQYLSLYRTFFGVKGKGGTKKFSGTNFKVDDEGVAIFSILEEERKGNDPLDQVVSINTDNPIVLQNIYKTLCKYFLSVIDTKYLKHFQGTIDWINGERQIDRLPVIAEVVTYHFFSSQPKLLTYIRKENNSDIPFAVGEFHFTCIVFVFIIPLCDQDSSQYLEDDYKKFWDLFHHYNKSKGWSFKDYSSQKAAKFSFRVKFEKSDV